MLERHPLRLCVALLSLVDASSTAVFNSRCGPLLWTAGSHCSDFSRRLCSPRSGAEAVQPGFEHCQGGDSHSFSGQPGPGPHPLTVKNFFLVSNLNLPSSSLKPSPVVLSLHALVTAPLQLSRSPSRHWQLLSGLPAAFSSPG